MDGGNLVDTQEVIEQILKTQGQDGITLSGGDPFFQTEACLEIAKACKQNNLNIWCYTGFTFEELIKISKKNKSILELLKNINILVDGKFIEKKKSMSLVFRGSKNQRILDVEESLKQGRAIEIKKYLPKPIQLPLFGKTEIMFI